MKKILEKLLKDRWTIKLEYNWFDSKDQAWVVTATKDSTLFKDTDYVLISTDETLLLAVEALLSQTAIRGKYE